MEDENGKLFPVVEVGQAVEPEDAGSQTESPRKHSLSPTLATTQITDSCVTIPGSQVSDTGLTLPSSQASDGSNVFQDHLFTNYSQSANPDPAKNMDVVLPGCHFCPLFRTAIFSHISPGATASTVCGLLSKIAICIVALFYSAFDKMSEYEFRECSNRDLQTLEHGIDRDHIFAQLRKLRFYLVLKLPGANGARV